MEQNNNIETNEQTAALQQPNEAAESANEQVIAAAQQVSLECVYLLAPKEGTDHE